MITPTGRTLFRARADEAAGTVTLHLTATPDGLVIALAATGREPCWVVLDRSAAQQVRHALTEWLVDASPAP